MNNHPPTYLEVAEQVGFDPVADLDHRNIQQKHQDFMTAHNQRGWLAKTVMHVDRATDRRPMPGQLSTKKQQPKKRR